VPLYEYECRSCGIFERIQKFAEPPLEACPTCGKAVEKLPSAPAIQFKGTGWYVTDYAKKSGEKPKDSDAPKDSGSAGGSSDGKSGSSSGGKGSSDAKDSSGEKSSSDTKGSSEKTGSSEKGSSSDKKRSPGSGGGSGTK